MARAVAGATLAARRDGSQAGETPATSATAATRSSRPHGMASGTVVYSASRACAPAYP